MTRKRLGLASDGNSRLEIIRKLATSIVRELMVGLDGHTCPISRLETGVLQGSPVLLILFIIYLSRIFKAIKVKAPIKALSFMDNIGLIALGSLI